MPLDAVKRSTKRIKSNAIVDNWYLQSSLENDKLDLSSNQYMIKDHHPFSSTPITIPIDIPYNTSPLDFMSFSPQSNDFWQEDNLSFSDLNLSNHRTSTSTDSTQYSTPQYIDSLLTDDKSIHSPTNHHLYLEHTLLKDVLSKIKLSYTDQGIHLEAKISNASEFTSLIDTFRQMCASPLLDEQLLSTKISSNKLYRNKSNQSKPVNFFESNCRLRQLSDTRSIKDASERLIADACIDTFFGCWVRFKPIMKRDDFMAWYKAHPNPLDTLIVNAICSYVFRHVVVHHPQPGFNRFIEDQDKLIQKEEYYFNRARSCLAAEAFESPPDRYTVLGLLCMSVRAEHTKRHYYVGMAITILHELKIFPRTVDEEVDDYDKEIDTRLWWLAWAIDFSLHTAGAPKNTPQPERAGQIVDFPEVFEQDIDECETGVIAFANCLKLWKIQSDIIATLYDEEPKEMTVEELADYDSRLTNFYNSLPNYLVLDSGFEYGCEDLFVACLRINIEYNATQIILHKLFVPEVTDSTPTDASLESLNRCLKYALYQLKAIKTCTMIDLGGCAFDRDELWRAAELISLAIDIYHQCSSPLDKEKILKGIKIQEFASGLSRAHDMLHNTREYKCSLNNWFQVIDWIKLEMNRHQENQHFLLDSKSIISSIEPDYFLAHLKPVKIIENHSYSCSSNISSSTKTKSTNSNSNSTKKKPISFQNQFSIIQPVIQSDRKSSFSPAPPFVQFNAYDPSDQYNGKNPARFRYFNPRKMNKFLFIDEHPMT